MADKFDIAAVRARLASLEGLPWRQVAGNHVHGADYVVCKCGGDLRDKEMRFSHETWRQNADFIAHAPTDLAAACDEIEKLREALKIIARGYAPTIARAALGDER